MSSLGRDAAGMTLDPNNNPMINWIWAGGDASTIVRVTLISNWNEIASYKPRLCTRAAPRSVAANLS